VCTFLLGSDSDEVAFFAFLAFLAAVDGQPARIDEHAAFGLEGFTGDAGDAGRDQVFGGREEDGEEPRTTMS
jgi:hypothetical protein